MVDIVVLTYSSRTSVLIKLCFKLDSSDMFYSNKTPTRWSSLVIAFKRFGVIKRNSAISVRKITRVKTIQKEKKHLIGRN